MTPPLATHQSLKTYEDIGNILLTGTDAENNALSLKSLAGLPMAQLVYDPIHTPPEMAWDG